MKQFEMTFIDEFGKTEHFNEDTAPSWLKGDGKRDTMDNRWFWDSHILTLNVGAVKETEFRLIKRLA